MREKVDTDPDLIGRVEFEGKGKGNGEPLGYAC